MFSLTTALSTVAALLSALVFLALISFRRRRRRFLTASRRRAKIDSRILDPMEESMEIGQRRLSLWIYTSVFFVESSEEVTLRAATEAFAAVARRHPLLRARIVEGAEGWSYLEEIEDFAPDVEFLTEGGGGVGDDAMWRRVFDAEIKKPFRSDKEPLWRVKILTPDVTNGATFVTPFILTVHHSIFDGNSCMRFFDEFLTNLNLLTSGNSLDASTPFTVSPGIISRLFTHQTSLSFLTKCGAFLYFSFRRMTPPVQESPAFLRRLRFSSSDLKPTSSASPRLLTIEFDAAFSSRLLDAARLHGATLHGAFEAAAHLALARAMKRADSFDPKSPVVSSFNIGLRRFTAPPTSEEEMGFFVSATFLTERFKDSVDDEDFWVFASRVSKTVRGILETNPVPGFMKFFKFLHELFPERLAEAVSSKDAVDSPRRTLTCFNVSNLGACDFLRKSEQRVFELASTFWATNEVVMGPFFQHNIVSVREKICWTLVYFDNAATPEFARSYASDVEDVLRGAVN